MNKTIDQQLKEARRLRDSYLDLAVDQEDDDAFVARGNGFCDRKYSDDFLQMQMAQLTARIAQLEQEKMKQEI